jgi:hypothetical protein
MNLKDKLKKMKCGIICASKKNENIILNFFGAINIGRKECTMKKLRVFLLAMVFIFGLAAQASAAEPVEPQVVEDEMVFAGDEPIMFQGPNYFNDDGVLCTLCTSLDGNLEYSDESGVSFSPSLYGSSSFGQYYMGGDTNTASNFNECTFGDTTDAPAITVTFDVPVTRVGFNGRSPAGEIMVTVFRGGVASEPIPFDTADQMKFIGIMDPEGIEAIEISGTGQFYVVENAFFIDEFRFGGTLDTGPTEVEVTMNVRPPNCLGASINVKSKGVIPVVIAGKDVDVTMIDPTTILLNGVAPVRSAIEDVPYCNNSGSDGYWDLTLKFDTQELVDAMETSTAVKDATLKNGDLSVLHLTGSLFDGTAIYADQPVSITGKPAKENQSKGKKRLFKSHSRHDRGHHKGWDNNRGHHKGWDKHR